MKNKLTAQLSVAAAVGLLPFVAAAHTPHVCSDLPDAPMFAEHMEHADIASGVIPMQDVFDHGEALFVGNFNKCDGQGRPQTTGGGAKRFGDHPEKLRTSAPDADSCAGCHAQPRLGGGGDFVANVFVLAQTLDPVTESVNGAFSNERNTLGMFGAGPIEMLAREMSWDLQAQAAGLPDGAHVLNTKGVDFEITIAGGAVVESRGVNTDLVIRPFHQAGAVVSLREFTDNAMNHHHGMQAEERFDMNPAMGFDPDFDEDGIERELTVGDITAVTLWQAQLGTPSRVMPADPARRQAAKRGEQLFADVDCTGCHKPKMYLESRHFVEPNPFNPPGTCADPSVCPPVSFDMTKDGEGPNLKRAPGGGAVVEAYTDLKRHNLCDDEGTPGAIRFFCNEQLTQGRPSQDGKPGTEFFLTRKLWDVGNSGPYGHRGDLSTIAEAILMHGGEARPSRDAFVALPREDQEAVVEFLKTLQVVPPDAERGMSKGKRKDAIAKAMRSDGD